MAKTGMIRCKWTSPASNLGFSTPFDLDVDVWNGSVILIWKTGESQSACSHHYQVSTDDGDTWSPKKQVFEGTFGCSTQNVFLSNRPDILIWMANINGQSTFLAWNGEQWSDPQVQTDLASIENPVTYEYVSLNCLQLVEQPAPDQVYAVGCEQGQNGDIWFMSRPIGVLSDWFKSAEAWSNPEKLFDVSPKMGSLNMLADQNGNFHAFWTQPVDENVPSSGSSVYYSQWDGIKWTTPVGILASPDGKAANPSVAINRDGRLLVAWSAGPIGELYFSWAQAERAYSPSEWSEPVSLPVPSSAASSPDLVLSASGEIFVAYAIPLNESRGIYIVSSMDDGATWSEPEQVFDASPAGWDMVQSPHLLLTGNGERHMLWKQQSFPGDTDSQVLFYTHYSDSASSEQHLGLSKGWSALQQVDEGQIFWSRLIALTDGGLYRLWFNRAAQNNSIYQQYSGDEGSSWMPANILGDFSDTIDALNSYVDLTGQFHLVQAINNSQQEQLRYWSGAGERLVQKDETSLASVDPQASIVAMAAAINPSGRLQVMFGVNGKNQADETFSYLVGLHRTIEQAATVEATASATTQPQSPTPSTDVIAPQVTSTEVPPTPQPTAITDLADLPVSSSGPLPGNLTGTVIFSAVVAGGLLVILLLIQTNPIKKIFQSLGKNGKTKQ